MKKIIPVWQPIGWSTNHLAKTISEGIGIKTSHTGTLDPMAEGVVIILAGEKRLEKIKLASWKKTYEFEIAFGIQTDSFDGMGLIKKVNFEAIKEINIKDILSKFKGKYTQNVPLYSAVKYKGKRLHEHAKLNNYVPELPTKNGQIFNIELMKSYNTNLQILIKKIIKNVFLSQGDFRQKEIISNWKDFSETIRANQKIQIAKVSVQVSRGIYIRSLSQDICKLLNTVGFVSSLVRTKNGNYDKKATYKLSNLLKLQTVTKVLK